MQLSDLFVAFSRAQHHDCGFERPEHKANSVCVCMCVTLTPICACLGDAEAICSHSCTGQNGRHGDDDPFFICFWLRCSGAESRYEFSTNMQGALLCSRLSQTIPKICTENLKFKMRVWSYFQSTEATEKDFCQAGFLAESQLVLLTEIPHSEHRESAFCQKVCIGEHQTSSRVSTT